MSGYIVLFQTDNKYAKMDPIPSEQMYEFVKKGKEPPISIWINEQCNRDKMRIYKGMVPEFCII